MTGTEPLYEDPEVRDRFDAEARRVQRQFWDSQAGEWDARLNCRGLQPRHVAAIGDWLCDPVLLIGAGRGLILTALRAEGHAAGGVDWSERMVAEARRDGVEGIETADAEALPFEAGRFGTVIVSSGVLMPTHTRARLSAYLAEARRVLAPGGSLVLCMWFTEGSTDARLAAEGVRLPIHSIHAQKFWDLDGLASVAAELGLERLAEFGCDDIRLWRLAPAAQGGAP